MGQIWPLTAVGLHGLYRYNLCETCVFSLIVPTKVSGEGPSCITEPMLTARKAFHGWPSLGHLSTQRARGVGRCQSWWELHVQMYAEGIACSNVCTRNGMLSASGGGNNCL